MVMTKKSEEAKEMKKRARPKMELAKVEYDAKMSVPRMGGEPKMKEPKKLNGQKKHKKKENAAHEKAEMKKANSLKKAHKKNHAKKGK